MVANSRDSWRSHVHRTYTAQRVQPFKLQTRNVGGRGGRPSPFSGGCKGGILFGKRIPPFLAAAHRAALFMQRQWRCNPHPPAKGRNQKGYPLRKENTPFVWQQRSALHYQCSANGAATSPSLKKRGGRIPAPLRAQKKSRPSDDSHFLLD